MELTKCAAADHVTHIRWHQLEFNRGGDSNTPKAAMLMSDGLCLGLPPPKTSTPESAAAVAAAAGGGAVQRPANDRVSLPSRTPPPPPLSAVRVTVSATNGIPFAVINEVRLFDRLGEQPFPAKP